MIEERGTQPETLLVTGDGEGRTTQHLTPSVHHQGRATRDAVGDVAANALEGRLADDRAHLGIALHAVADAQPPRPLGELRYQRLSGLADQHRHGHRHAALTRRAVGGPDERIGSLLEVGVRHDHHVILGTPERLHALTGGDAALRDVVRDRRRADEAHRTHLAMIEQRIHRRLVALYHVEDAGGEPGLLQQARHEERSRGVALARLEHEGVAARDRERKHPARHHAWKVEGRDAGDHAERLTQRPVVEAGGHLVGEVTLQQLRNATGKFHDLDAA